VKGEVRTSFCEQKEAKKLYPAGCGDRRANSHGKQKFFASFFQKRSASFRLQSALIKTYIRPAPP
jgi:hypothetical protein